MPPSAPVIRSVVVAARIAPSLDLQQLQEQVAFSRFEVTRARSIQGRLAKSGPLVSIFTSGRAVVSGRATLEGAFALLEEIRQLASHVDDAVFTAPVDGRVENIVAQMDLDRRIDLPRLVVQLGEYGVEYEPEVFPGLILRAPETSVTVLMFSSGKIMLTGAKNIEDLRTTAKWLREAV